MELLLTIEYSDQIYLGLMSAVGP